jgi:hypothetical protein
MTMKTMIRTGACAALCVAATGAVAAVADQPPTPPSEANAPPTSPTPAVQSAQSRRFAELRRERGSDDRMPDTWERAVATGTDSGRRWGANPALSRRVAPGVWLIPGDGFVCVANVGPRDGTLGLGCATPAEVDQGLLQPADLDAEGAGVVTGVLPDGVSSVTLVDRDGSSRSAAVERNVYRAAVDSELAEVRWVDGLGVGHSLPMAWTR